MVANGGKQLKVPVLPPRELIVRKFAESRAPELESLHSAIAKSDFKSQRNKRRRTTSYDNRASKTRFRKKQKLGVVLNRSGDENAQKGRPPPRHIRRRKELNSNPESGLCSSGDGTKRLRTHVWHAKRFTMTKRWGFHLPLGLQGRGKGSRSLLKWLKNGAIVHDASYCCAVQLEGSQDSLLSILSTLMTPFPSAYAEKVLSGVIYANAMLHHAEAPFFSMISPVTYMWRPLSRQLAVADGESSGTVGCDDNVKINECPSSRQLWVWIHAAAFTEGYNALKTACEKQGKTDGAAGLVCCTSLEGKLATLEVMGSKASQLLCKILHPVTCLSKESSVFKRCSFMLNVAQFTNASILENEEHISSSGIISLTVNDPRGLTKEWTGIVTEVAHSGILGQTKGYEERDNLGGTSERNVELDSDFTDLWDNNKQLSCPLEESVLYMEKHHQRMSSFCLSGKNSEEVNASTKMHSSRFCPILLLRRDNMKGSITRWSVILPISWVKAFWVPLISNGARAIGLREKRWVAGEAGMPNFPSDFPECSAYSFLMEADAAAFDREANLRPASMRPLGVPIPPPWDCVRLAFEKISPRAGNAHVCSKGSPVADNWLSNLAFGDYHVEAHVSHVLFKGLVARTSSMLSYFLNAINGDSLLIFPYLRDKKISISKIMKDEARLGQGPSASYSLAGENKNMCFLRINVHAYKEGVIEEGAVVCAPLLADIKLWTSGSNNTVDLQIPQSLVATSFVKQSCGKWEFQVPQNAEAMEFNRWPIGFVTNGFVRGSKKPMAGALCEAVLLAHLRHEQWSSVPVKHRRKEIYVLVRNLRSTAYRLALASIVLEQQEEDLEYI